MTSQDKNNLLHYSEVWNKFVQDIRSKNRFIPSSDFMAYIDKLSQVSDIIRKDQVLYRARIIKEDLHGKMSFDENPSKPHSGIRGLPIEETVQPPSKHSMAGRANPTGISYLYLASSPQVACVEVRPSIGNLISASAFQSKNDLKIFNLQSFSSKDVPAESNLDRVQCHKFIQAVMWAFASPCKDQNDIEYAPTQYIAAYLKSKGFDGIRYYSSNDWNQESYNVVVFDPSKVPCIQARGEVFQCTYQEVHFKNVSLLHENIRRVKSKRTIYNSAEVHKLKCDIKYYIQQSNQQTEVTNA